jgi:CHAT domain-containing protein/Tfp pilus assembly protein PilF
MMSGSALTEAQEGLIERLIEFQEEGVRIEFLQQNPQLQQQSVVLFLADHVAKVARENVDSALHLAEAASWLAEKLNDEYCRAKSARAMGHVHSLKGRYQEALQSYQKAVDLFQNLGQEVEASRTLSGSIQPLIYLGEYEEAHHRAAKAREVFKRHGDLLRLARLDNNLANALHRQDRFEEAIVLYRRGLQQLEACGEYSDLAINLNNIASCCISLQDFKSALEAYQRARTYSVQEQMPQLTTQVDYNIAYLHYLRGDYAKAIDLYQRTRVICEEVGDAYHSALCDLDQAEIYLDLNLLKEAAQVAEKARRGFGGLRMRYELAKATTFLAIAMCQQGESVHALELFAEARELFVSERNSLWPAMLDLYRALVFFQSGRAKEALGCVESAQSVLFHSGIANKTALADLLRALLLLQLGDITAAEYWSNAALERIERSRIMRLRYLAHFVRGQVLEYQNDAASAHQCYRKAVSELENLPNVRHAEEARIPLLKNRLPIYESLIASLLRQPKERNPPAATFEVVEKAKSQLLADLIPFGTHGRAGSAARPSERFQQITDLRREVDRGYRQMGLVELSKEKRSPEHLGRLRESVRENESRLLRALEEVQTTDTQFSPPQNEAVIPLESIVRTLPADAALLNYFELRGNLCAWLLHSRDLKMVTLSPTARVRTLLGELREDFVAVRKIDGSKQGVAGHCGKNTEMLLKRLYSALIEPLREHFPGRRLIIVPHGFLHYIPFYALFDGSRFLVDEFTISYSLSASLYFLCSTRKHRRLEERSVVVGVSSREVPRVDEEAREVASALPKPRLLLGNEATEASLREYGPGCHYIHFATQAVYRYDNPSFSTLALEGSSLSLFDLYRLEMPCSLVTLIGCGPALDEVRDGQEHACLVSGFHSAGAQAVLTNLWHVQEPSHSSFFINFYRQLGGNPDTAEALRLAILELRKTCDHAYHWAPFALWGGSAPNRHH